MNSRASGYIMEAYYLLVDKKNRLHDEVVQLNGRHRIVLDMEQGVERNEMIEDDIAKLASLRREQAEVTVACSQVYKCFDSQKQYERKMVAGGIFRD